MIPSTKLRVHGASLVALALLTACAGPGPGSGSGSGSGLKSAPSSSATPLNQKPAFLGAFTTQRYDGIGDDLLTAGLGRAGLALATAPTLSSPPTAAELRRLAIYSNYRALVDTSAGGGYGSLYGPNVEPSGVSGPGTGLIGGTESLTYLDNGSGRQNVTLMVQIPGSFNPDKACIISASSSGSRGVYGAIGSAGEWGLKRGCAVAYTDKGTGNGVHDLMAHTVSGIDGQRLDAAAAGKSSQFTARLSETERAEFNAATPNRFAVKHAHSQQNSEQDWGRHTLRAVQFAVWLLNERYGQPLANGARSRRLHQGNTLVIASSVSNGAGAALAAAEQDSEGWIDGVAVSEPNVQLPLGGLLRIERSGLPTYSGGSKPLFDYFSYANLLQPCAALAASASASPFALAAANAAAAALRCAALVRVGLISGVNVAQQAADAMDKLLAYGWEPETRLLHASHFLFATPAIAVTYANAYASQRVSDNLCGFSFGVVDAAGASTALAPSALAAVFGTGNGIPPTGGLQILYNPSVGGARAHLLAVSPSTRSADLAFDGALCLRQLWTDAGARSGAQNSEAANRLKVGVAQTYRSANLRGKPTLIVHGRSDTLVPVNFSSRPYVLRNAQVERGLSQLRYIEVENAQHFDAFLPLAGFDNRFVPLHLYFIRAMDAMWQHLNQGTALPPSQLVRTTPRGGSAGAAPALTAANVPKFLANPSPADLIVIEGADRGTLRLP